MSARDFGAATERASHSLGLILPFVTRDLYGFRVVPENLTFANADDVASERR